MAIECHLLQQRCGALCESCSHSAPCSHTKGRVWRKDQRRTLCSQTPEQFLIGSDMLSIFASNGNGLFFFNHRVDSNYMLFAYVECIFSENKKFVLTSSVWRCHRCRQQTSVLQRRCSNEFNKKQRYHFCSCSVFLSPFAANKLPGRRWTFFWGRASLHSASGCRSCGSWNRTQAPVEWKYVKIPRF